MIISTNDLRRGIKVIFQDRLVEVVSSEFYKPGKGSSFIRARFRDMGTGQVIDHTFKGPQKIEQAYVEVKEVEYLYRDGQNYVFMDTETYEQTSLHADHIKDALPYLKENLRCQTLIYNGSMVRLDVPDTVDLKVSETTPGVRGDTAQGGTKPATLETGLVVTVPLFVNEGETIRVDTRTGKYLERA